MVVKGGFFPQLFEERHFQRNCVRGSLNGWIAPPKEKVDDIIGFCPEILEVSSHAPSRDITTNLNAAGMLNPFSTKNEEGLVPLDYLPDQKNSTNPFTKKEVENVLHGVMSGYQNMSISRQHDISMLVLDLQELMTSPEHASMVVNKRHNGSSLMAPTQKTLKKESQKRLKSKKETAILATTAKKMRATQQFGFNQTVSLYGNEIEVVGTAKRHCSFCNGEHGVNTCGKLSMKSTTSKCYTLTSKDNKPMIELKDRLKVTMPVTTEFAAGLVFGVVDSKMKNANFIIHEASLIVGLACDHIEHLNYRITFLDKFANDVDGAKDFWIGGHSMQILVGHSNRTVKYVFDETINHKAGWCQRMQLTMHLSQYSQLGTQLSQYGSL